METSERAESVAFAPTLTTDMPATAAARVMRPASPRRAVKGPPEASAALLSCCSAVILAASMATRDARSPERKARLRATACLSRLRVPTPMTRPVSAGR